MGLGGGGAGGQAFSQVRPVFSPRRLGPVLGVPGQQLAVAQDGRSRHVAGGGAAAAIRSSLEPGQTSVGTSAVMEHKRPSPLGAEIVVEAELTEVDGRRLVF